MSYSWMSSSTPKLTASAKKVTDAASLLGSQLADVYARKPGVDHVFYNDQWPNGSWTEDYGHSKGAVVADAASGDGFFLHHSIPDFPNYVKDGWNLPGDTFKADADGYYYYQARSDDMIVSAGYNIAGPEVEGTLLSHPAVAECGVVGAPDPDRGRIVKAYIVLKPGVTGDAALAKELQDYVKAELAPYKYPRAIEFVSELPRTETGKLQRFALREIAANESGDAGSARAAS